MSTSSLPSAASESNGLLAIDMTALWKRKTTGIQRVIRELTPYLAVAAAQRGWEVVLVRKTEQGLEQIAHWTGGYDLGRLQRDLDQIAAGQVGVKCGRRAVLTFHFVQKVRALGKFGVGRLQIRQVIRKIRGLVPNSLRTAVRRWKGKDRRLCIAADAYISLSGGILPALPPASTPPERTVIVIHDLIPLHYPAYYSVDMAQAFVNNLANLAFNQHVSPPRLVTASRHVAADIEALIRSLTKKQIDVEVVQWGYDRETFFPQPDITFRQQLGLPAEALLVAAVSTQDARKRFVEIERAVAAMNAYAVFLGQGQPRRVGNAIYLGYVSDAELRRAYSSSDVVVNWSAAEGFGLSTIEALACGARVVVPPDNPTSLEVGGANVVVAERADIAALCEAIQRAATMPRPHPDLTRFNWATPAAQLEAMLWPETTVLRKAA